MDNAITFSYDYLLTVGETANGCGLLLPTCVCLLLPSRKIDRPKSFTFQHRLPALHSQSRTAWDAQLGVFIGPPFLKQSEGQMREEACIRDLV